MAMVQRDLNDAGVGWFARARTFQQSGVSKI